MSPTVRITALFGLLIAFVGIAGTTSAVSASDFHQGEGMKIIIHPPAGSADDAYARLLARHMIDHIPGNPSIMLPVNMPGGGGIRVEIKLGMFTTTSRTGRKRNV